MVQLESPRAACAAALLSIALAASGCQCDGGGSDSGVPIPPEICNDPVVLDGLGPYYVDVTDEMGIGLTGYNVVGNRISAGDIDGDGYPDLFVGPVGAMVRDDLDASPPVQTRWVLMNRPDPADPSRRIFVDASAESGFFATRDGGEGRAATMAIFGDVDDDGDLDVYSSAYVDANNTAGDTGDRSEVMLNDGTGHFSLGPPGPFGDADMVSASAASFLDFDADGRVDLYTGHWYAAFGVSAFGMQNRLYRGLGDGAFEDVTYAAGLATYPLGAMNGTDHRATYGTTACDVDSDGDQDILVSAYGRAWNMLWRNDGGTFVNIAAEVGFDGDDVLDYSDNQFYHCYCFTTGACVAPMPLINCAQSAWNPGSDDQPWRLNGNTFTTVCADVDNDLDFDVFSAEIKHWHIGISSDTSELLINTPGSGGAPWTFVRPGNMATGLYRDWTGIPDWNEGDIFAELLDFDNDTRPDIYLGSSDYPGTRAFFYWQGPDGVFDEIGPVAGIDRSQASGLAVADLDLDGDLDIVIGSGIARAEAWPTAEVHVFRNEVGAAGNFMALRLRGAGAAAGGANGAGIGAHVTVEAGGVTMIREVSGGYGHQGIHNTTYVTFGLGVACAAERVTVRWLDPAGTVETFEDVRANYYLEIEQGVGLRYLVD